MKARLQIGWVLASAIWMLAMTSMSFDDLKYGVQYYTFYGTMQEDHQKNVAAYEREKQKVDEHIQALLLAARTYDDLQFRSLELKRVSRPSRIEINAGKDGESLVPKNEYERVVLEIAALEKKFGQTQLRTYREPTDEKVQILRDSLQGRLLAPQLTKPRLGEILFHMLATPLVLLLALLLYQKKHVGHPLWSRYFGTGRN